MSKDHNLDDAELANISGAGGQLDETQVKEDGGTGTFPGGSSSTPGDGTSQDDGTQQDDVGGGLTDPNLG